MSNTNNNTPPSRDALMDCLQPWLNGDHQAQLQELEAARAAAIRELDTVYRAWQTVYTELTRVRSSHIDLYDQIADYKAILAAHSIPDTVMSIEELMANEIIDLTSDDEDDIQL